jgi:hypothetical protein
MPHHRDIGLNTRAEVKLMPRPLLFQFSAAFQSRMSARLLPSISQSSEFIVSPDDMNS